MDPRQDIPSIEVIVCAHDMARLAQVKDAVRSLAAQSCPPSGVIVVVDHNAALRDRLTSDLAGAARVIENTAAKGLSGARNTGITAATADVIAFLDDDAVAEPDWLERLAGHYRDPRLIGVGGRADPVWPGGARPGWFPPEFDWVVGCTHLGCPEQVAPVRNLIGCNMSFRRSVFEDIGGFEATLGRNGADAAGGEETELCIRAAAAYPGGRFLMDPGARVRHSVTAERTGWRYFRRRCLAEGRSKAAITARWGAGVTLASERTHTRRLLGAALRGAGRGLVRLDATELKRAGALVGGFALVAGAYLVRRRSAPGVPEARPAFSALRVVDLGRGDHPRDLAGPGGEATGPYRGAFCLVRQDGRPVDVLQVPLFRPDLAVSDIARLYGDAPVAIPARADRPATDPARLPQARVIVATRNRPETLAQCLDTLLAQDHPAAEIVVVDNAPSDDRTREMIAARYADRPSVRYVREERPGLGRAHNAGLADLTHPVVAITDDDVLVDPDWLGALCANFADDPTVGCATGLILPRELETRAQYWTECHGGFGKGFARRTFDLSDAPGAGPLFPYAAGAFGSGANMAFSAEALRRIGGFDPALGAGTVAKGGDDLAAFVAVIRAGFRIVYEPAAIVWHLHRRNEEGMARQAFSYGVGLGAYLTKVVVDDPRTLVHFLRAAPAGLAHLFSRGSDKNTRLPGDYPSRLRRSEQLGVLVGVPSYLVSRRRAKAERGGGGGAVA